MNAHTYAFDAVLHKVEGIDGAYVIFPYDVHALFQKRRVKVSATFDGIPLRAS